MLVHSKFAFNVKKKLLAQPKKYLQHKYNPALQLLYVNG